MIKRKLEATILVQYCRTDTTREWLDTTRTTRTIRTGRETMVYESYRSWNNGGLHIISKTALQPPQYDPYDPYGSYRSWNNGLRIVQLVNPMDIYIMISNTVEHIWAVNGSRDKHTKNNVCSSFQKVTSMAQSVKHCEYYSFSKRESPS